jgi:hypothetical protein
MESKLPRHPAEVAVNSMDTPIDKVSQKYVKWFRYKPEQEILGLNSNYSTDMRVCGEHVN